MAATGCFISDLHLFSRRSEAPRYQRAIHLAAAGAPNFVLGGDIFDFRWSMLPSAQDTVDAALSWLDDLVGSHSHCQFHFVLGNHDCNLRFVGALEKYSRTRDNLLLHPFVLRQGNNVFLHGDAADHPQMCGERLARRRERWQHDEKRKGEVPNLFYDAAVRAGLHKLCGQVLNPRQKVARRLGEYLDRIGVGLEAGVKNVYFGHTHEALSNFEHGGLQFHNGGAPIAGLDFRIVEIEAG